MSFKRIQRRLVRVLAVLVALSVVFCAGLYVYRTFFGYNYDSTLSMFEEDLAAGIQADENITNIALFGLDTREGDTQSHSDCMMIVSVDNTRGKIKLISLMRDSLIDLEGYGPEKLNSAYYAGGPSLAIRTINQNFGTDITEYIAVNFEQLVEIVDALDGVEINVQTQEELDELNRVIRDYGIEQGKTFKSVERTGVQTLDGVQALCYGRIRKGNTGDDWARVERQSIVLEAMFEKVQTMSASPPDRPDARPDPLCDHLAFPDRDRAADRRRRAARHPDHRSTRASRWTANGTIPALQHLHRVQYGDRSRAYPRVHL